MTALCKLLKDKIALKETTQKGQDGGGVARRDDIRS